MRRRLKNRAACNLARPEQSCPGTCGQLDAIRPDLRTGAAERPSNPMSGDIQTSKPPCPPEVPDPIFVLPLSDKRNQPDHADHDGIQASPSCPPSRYALLAAPQLIGGNYIVCKTWYAIAPSNAATYTPRNSTARGRAPRVPCFPCTFPRHRGLLRCSPNLGSACTLTFGPGFRTSPRHTLRATSPQSGRA